MTTFIKAYLALVVKQLSTSKVRRYVKTGAAEVPALLMNVFGYKVLEDAPGEIVKGMAIEDRLDVMVSMPFIVGLSATFICSLYPLAAIPGCLSLCPERLWQFTKDSAGMVACITSVVSTTASVMTPSVPERALLCFNNL